MTVRAREYSSKAGEIFAGNRAARRIFTAVKRSLDTIDTYFGPEVFDLLEVTQQSVKIRLISDKAKNPTKQANGLFNQQYGQRVEFRLCDPKDIHDRFILLDDRSALHVGASIKDLGKSDSVIDAAQFDAHAKRFCGALAEGQPSYLVQWRKVTDIPEVPLSPASTVTSHFGVS
jgi:hypothetical protein